VAQRTIVNLLGNSVNLHSEVTRHGNYTSVKTKEIYMIEIIFKLYFKLLKNQIITYHLQMMIVFHGNLHQSPSYLLSTEFVN
jgi:hypothetical protein